MANKKIKIPKSLYMPNGISTEFIPLEFYEEPSLEMTNCYGTIIFSKKEIKQLLKWLEKNKKFFGIK